MAETTKTNALEREYTIPLRKEWTKVPRYKRTSKSVKAIKEFIARHMKVPNRDLDKVKVDSYLNNEVWFRGSAKPPAKITVKAIKSGDIVKVTFVSDPEHVKFARQRHTKKHFKAEKKVIAPAAEKKADEKTDEEKKAESEKEKSAAIANEEIAKQHAKEHKHVAVDNKANKKAPVQRRRTIASS